MAKVMETLFPVELTSARRAPPIHSAPKLSAKHWTSATGKEIAVPAHNYLDLVTCVLQEWQANIRRADALATHTEELQAHVAALEEWIANPTKEPPAGGPLTNPRPTPNPTPNASQRSPKRGSSSGNGQRPAASSARLEGSAQNEF